MTGQDIVNLYGGLSQVTSIAVNWLNSDVYLTTAAGAIEKITISSASTKTPLISGRSSPRHLALDAEDGLVSIMDISTSMNCYTRAGLCTGLKAVATMPFFTKQHWMDPALLALLQM